MQLGRVIGNVVANEKDERLVGVKLMVVQPINSDGSSCGNPLVAVDTIGAGSGEIIFYARSKEGAMGLPDPNACADAGIIAIVDSVYRI